MIVRERRISEKEYQQEFEEATTKCTSLYMFTKDFTKAIARYNFFPVAGTRITGTKAVEKYYDGIEKMGYGTLRVHTENKVGNTDNLALVGSAARKMAQRIGVKWGSEKNKVTGSSSGVYSSVEDGGKNTKRSGSGRGGGTANGNPSDQQERKLRCYNCGAEGHLANECPHSLCKCFKCGEYEGHHAKDCPYTEAEIRAKKRKRREDNAAEYAKKRKQDSAAAAKENGENSENKRGWENRLPADQK